MLSPPLRTGEVGSLPPGRGPAYALLYRTLPLLSQLFMDTTSYQGTLYFSAVRVSCDVHTWLPCDMSCLSCQVDETALPPPGPSGLESKATCQQCFLLEPPRIPRPGAAPHGIHHLVQ